MKDYLKSKLLEALRKSGIETSVDIFFEKPKAESHGDLSTNFALLAAKEFKMKPREIAQKIVGHIEVDSSLVESCEIAGPGFINFKFTKKYFVSFIREVLNNGEAFGRSSAGAGKKTQVEFVSANPTGPLTVGHGRNAVFGDTVANLLEWTGHEVTREYYFNNAGRQMRVLGDSVRLRYKELLGEGINFPDDYYQGEYIREIAKHLYDEHGTGIANEPPEGIFKEKAEHEIFEDIKKTLNRLRIEFDVFYNENSLYETGKIKEVISALESAGLAYDKEGAKWFKATAVGGDQDKVIVKSSGEPTYRLPDVAYHIEKFRRGFELIVDIFGSDHIATYPDVLLALKSLGYDTEKIKVLIHQFVTIFQNGEVVKMSTRKANFITLDELIDWVGADAVRFFFLMRSIGTHLNFDIDLAKKQSDENPVFYLQYAHARIASIIRFAESEGISPKDAPGQLSTVGSKLSAESLELLREKEEIELAKMLGELPEVIEAAASTFEPHRIISYLQEVAEAFHRFYHLHRVVIPDRELAKSRLALCLATKIVLANGFEILGISAPEKM
ncbi:MAG TPA: arginine--tRNA ligase [Candidatus Acidoferrales bacterium]|nr:arginine--tRNA ligase [Candidatus Acidoferrales bacterium]